MGPDDCTDDRYLTTRVDVNHRVVESNTYFGWYIG